MPSVARSAFGVTDREEPVDAFTLENGHGLAMRVITYGAIITAFHAPDRAGRAADVVLGFDDMGGYLADSPYFGAVVGRCANRIARGRFTLDGETYTLATNNGQNHLHGGVRGFDKRVWRASVREGAEGAPALRLAYRSADGEEGYPGTLDAAVTYTLARDALVIDYHATCDRATPVNLTQHSYWNLAGAGDILDHQLTVYADRYTPVDAGLIPTGELASVTDTPFDFRRAARVGARVDDDDAQLVRAGGYDHNFVLRDAGAGELRHAARLHHAGTGRSLDVHTTEPGMQLYSGNFLDGSIRGKGGRVYGHRAALCLETQHFPDSPNEPGFPSVILRPGAALRSRTVLRFSAG